jgi:hypothetical protein
LKRSPAGAPTTRCCPTSSRGSASENEPEHDAQVEGGRGAIDVGVARRVESPSGPVMIEVAQ